MSAIELRESPPAELEQAVRGSWLVVSAYSEGKLVGTGRVVSDGVFHALIGRGIGRAIMRRLIDRCRAAGIRDVQLFSAKGKAEFYRGLGFMERPAGAPGMDLKSVAMPGPG